MSDGDYLADLWTTKDEIQRIRREIEVLHNAEREAMENLQWLTFKAARGRLREVGQGKMPDSA